MRFMNGTGNMPQRSLGGGCRIIQVCRSQQPLWVVDVCYAAATHTLLKLSFMSVYLDIPILFLLTTEVRK
jgi:hypothetical protein